MNLKATVVLVALGATIAVGGKTIAVKTLQGTKAAVHSKVAHKVAAPFVWAGKRVVH